MEATTTPPAAPGDEALSRRTILALAAMGLAIFLIANDITSLTVALPTIERDFDTDVSTVQWVANAYTLVFGVLIVTGGRLSDMFGRRRMFFAGTALFAGFSILAALAPSAPVLIAARAAMAVGAALIWPAVVGILFSLLPAAKAGIAGGLLLGVSGVGNACGPLIGGLLTDAASWRWILVLNIPIALASALVVRAEVAPEAPPDSRERLDYAGVALLSVGLVGVLVALDQSSSWGWGDPKTLGLLAVGVLALVALVVVQLRLGDRALVPRDVITNRVFGLACLTTLLASGTWFALLLYGPQFMQKVLGFSALGSGLGFLPLMLVYTAASFAAGPLYNRIGGRLLLIIGAACLALGALGLSFLGTGSPYAATLPGFAVLGIGVGFFYSTLTNLAITSLDPARSSVGGGLLFMFQLVGGAIGVVLTTAVFFGAGGDLAGATAAGELPAAAKQAFVDGLHAGLLVDAGLGFLALLTALLVVRRRRTPLAGAALALFVLLALLPTLAGASAPLRRPQPKILSASWGTEGAVGCPNGEQGLDNIPVTFDWFLRRASIQPADFRIVRNDGSLATPTCALQFPPDERDEAQTVNLIGDFGDAASGPTPVAIRIVGALQGKAPGASRWRSIGHLPRVKVEPLAGGPYIVDAWTLMPSIYRGDRNRCQVGQTFVRVMWSNGLTAYPTGEEVGAPVTSSYRALYTLPSGKTDAIAPLEVADLHDHETSFNADNMHDLCLPRPPRGATLAGVTIAAELTQDPDGDPNLAQRFRVSAHGS